MGDDEAARGGGDDVATSLRGGSAAQTGSEEHDEGNNEAGQLQKHEDEREPEEATKEDDEEDTNTEKGKDEEEEPEKKTITVTAYLINYEDDTIGNMEITLDEEITVTDAAKEILQEQYDTKQWDICIWGKCMKGDGRLKDEIGEKREIYIEENTSKCKVNDGGGDTEHKEDTGDNEPDRPTNLKGKKEHEDDDRKEGKDPGKLEPTGHTGKCLMMAEYDPDESRILLDSGSTYHVAGYPRAEWGEEGRGIGSIDFGTLETLERPVVLGMAGNTHTFEHRCTWELGDYKFKALYSETFTGAVLGMGRLCMETGWTASMVPGATIIDKGPGGDATIVRMSDDMLTWVTEDNRLFKSAVQKGAGVNRATALSQIMGGAAITNIESEAIQRQLEGGLEDRARDKVMRRDNTCMFTNEFDTGVFRLPGSYTGTGGRVTGSEHGTHIVGTGSGTAEGTDLPDLREFVRVKSLKQSGDHFDGFRTMWVHASRVSIHDPTTGEYENIYAGLIDAGGDTTEDDEKQKKKVMGKVEQKFNECGGRQKRSWFEMNEEERKEILLEWGKIKKKRLKATQAEQSMGGSSK